MSEFCWNDDTCTLMAEPSFISAAAAAEHETAALTKTLQIALSSPNSFSAAAEIEPAVQPLPGPLRPGNMAAAQRPGRRISKRRPRASRRAASTTTYIAAEPENFRQMVQQVTGGRSGRACLGPAGPAEQVWDRRPEGGGGYCSLPTLDTSAFVLAGTGFVEPPPEPKATAAAAGFDDFDEPSLFASFPTLESWDVFPPHPSDDADRTDVVLYSA